LKEIEAIIARIQGVVSGRLVCKDGEIVEIHVLADATRTPKQVVRDIESAVMVKLGLELDHRQISVAQLEQGSSLPVSDEIRLLFRGINYTTENGTATVNITVDKGSEIFSADQSGPNTRQNRLRLTAAATLSAVEQCVNSEAKFSIGDVQRVNIYGSEVITSAVCLFINRQEEVLLGSAMNKGDDLESTVRATLDAVNRRLFKITGDKV
jgi:hypothetical protein